MLRLIGIILWRLKRAFVNTRDVPRAIDVRNCSRVGSEWLRLNNCHIQDTWEAMGEPHATHSPHVLGFPYTPYSPHFVCTMKRATLSIVRAYIP